MTEFVIDLRSPLHAVGFVTVASLSGLGILYYGVNALTAGLGLANFILYTSIYTPMKRYSILNTWVGSIGKYSCIHFTRSFFIKIIAFQLEQYPR